MFKAAPSYDTEHSGPLLVVGPATCALADVAAARAIFPDAPVMVVNHAALLLPADFIVSQHHEILATLRGEHIRRFLRKPSVHCACPEQLTPAPGIDHWWRGAASGATSTWGAVRVAKAMGFAPVVLCGCPMVGGDGYAVDIPLGNGVERKNLVGYAEAASGLVKNYQQRLIDAARAEGKGVYSMSGFTRQVLGAPDAG